MRLLLDTHVLLWLLDDPRLVSPTLLDTLRGRPALVVSVASLWEIAIKRAKGKLRAPDDLPDRLSQAGFELLPVTASHAWAVRAPTFGPAHKDPFDRLLYAQALMERLTFATRDTEPPAITRAFHREHGVRPSCALRPTRVSPWPSQPRALF